MELYLVVGVGSYSSTVILVPTRHQPYPTPTNFQPVILPDIYNSGTLQYLTPSLKSLGDSCTGTSQYSCTAVPVHYTATSRSS